MPWSEKQHAFFEAVAHGMKARDGGPSKADAAKMAAEGVKGRKKRARKIVDHGKGK